MYLVVFTILMFFFLNESRAENGKFFINGVVVLQDKHERRIISTKEGQLLPDVDISLYQKDTNECPTNGDKLVWLPTQQIKADDKGRYLATGKKSSSEAKCLIAIEAKAEGGEYATTSPVEILVKEKKNSKELLLRSRENSASYIYNECGNIIKINDGSIEKMDGINFNTYIECLNTAYEYHNDPKFLWEQADAYDYNKSMEDCWKAFDRVSLFYLQKNERTMYEKSILRTASCMEKLTQSSDSPDQWAILSSYVRNSFKNGIANRETRSKLFRIWFDSFINKNVQGANLRELSIKIERNSDIKDEWIDLFYKNYFWGKAESIPNHYNSETALRDIIIMSQQYNRNYEKYSGHYEASPPGRMRGGR